MKARHLAVSTDSSASQALLLTAAFALLAVAYLLSALVLPHTALNIPNKVLPAVFAVLCVAGAHQIIRGTQYGEWSPLLWFLLASGVYYGAGPLAQYFSSEETRHEIDLFFFADDRMTFRTNVLNAFNTVAVLFGYFVAAKVRLFKDPLARLVMPRRAENLWLVLFALVGIPVRFGLSIPGAVDYFSVSVPASVLVFQSCFSALVFLMTKLSFEGRKALVPWLVVLMTADTVGALLSLSKLAIISAWIPIVLGVFSARRRLRVLIGGAALLLVLYRVTVPLVAFARESVGFEDTSARARMEAVQSFRYSQNGDDSGELQRWWARLNYVPVQAFVMKEFDEGRPDSTAHVLAYAFIPRLLWPAKPAVTTGRNLTFLINGSDTSQSAPTVVGECYWAMGWLGVALGGAWVGLVYSVLDSTIRANLDRAGLGVLPLAFEGVRIGLRPDDAFVTTYISFIPLLAVLYLGIRFIARFTRPEERRCEDTSNQKANLYSSNKQSARDAIGQTRQ